MNERHMLYAVVGLALGTTLACGAFAAAHAQSFSRAPIAALDKARGAVAVNARRAAQHDAEAAKAFGAGIESAAPAPADAPANVGSGADTPVAAPAATAPAVAAAPHAGEEHASASGKYDPNQHRDPFRPPNLTPTVAEGPKTPLEGYEIGQLKLVGVVSGGPNTRAMVEDSAGLGYIVTTGTPIGTRGGVVQRIEQRRMLIEETTTNFYGEKQPREVVMELPQEDRSP